MQLIVIDFETVWDSNIYSLSKMPTEAYIRDPKFRAHGLCWQVFGGGEPVEWVSHDDIPAWVERIDWAHTAVIAHNAVFDVAILMWVYGAHPKVVLDTLSMARALRGVDAGGSLAKLAEHYMLPPKGKAVYTTDGMATLTPEIEHELAEYCKHDVYLCSEIFKRFIAEGFPNNELKLIDITLRMFLTPVLELDADMLEQHLADVKNLKENLLESAGVTQEDLASNPKFAALLETMGIACPMKISPTTGKETWALAKTDDGLKELAEHPNPVIQALVAARLGAKSTLEETRTASLIAVAARGLLPVQLKYYGARTGRWSADGGLNMQNIPRGSKIKKAICAPEGMMLVGADLSNIELRVGLWLAGQMDKLQMLADGLDLYKDFASKVFGVAYEDVTDVQRFIGKTSQLSLIYGVGAAKLRRAIKQGSGKDIGEEESKRIVQMYRGEYTQVTQAWRDGERVLVAIASDTALAYGPEAVINVEGKEGCLLPSGMHMKYPGLEKVVVDGKFSWQYHTRKGTEHLYGAKVFQGLTQALARCIMGDGMLRTAKQYPVALTVHDAEYFLCQESDVESAKRFVIECLCTPPSWGMDIPLAAECGAGKNLAFKMRPLT